MHASTWMIGSWRRFSGIPGDCWSRRLALTITRKPEDIRVFSRQRLFTWPPGHALVQRCDAAGGGCAQPGSTFVASPLNIFSGLAASGAQEVANGRVKKRAGTSCFFCREVWELSQGLAGICQSDTPQATGAGRFAAALGERFRGLGLVQDQNSGRQVLLVFYYARGPTF
ncbi:unnamed protein product [Symbiodinium natans]|uniref:Uncharacterized protein n=1 Tax=Symbiodinium natans TaxID=878477 RepID=A0A812I880_9DINO|nr:unnamed protein product [Symbiodinium natans]